MSIQRFAPIFASGLTVSIALVVASGCSSSDDDSTSNAGTGGTGAGMGGSSAAGKGGTGTGGAGTGGTAGASAGTTGAQGGRGGAGAGGTSAGTAGASAGAAGTPCPMGGAGAGGASTGGMSGGAAGGVTTGGVSGGMSAGGASAGGVSGGGMSGTSTASGGGGVSGVGGAGGAPPTCQEIPPLAMGDASFMLSSPAFANCMPFPASATCDAKPFPQGSSPALTWTAGPSGTLSYAVVLKDLSVLARTATTDANYNRGYHYVMWNIPATVMSLPAGMMGGFGSPDVPGAAQWSNFNDYGYFGPCPNFDPTMPTDYNDSYAFEVYALPVAKADVPAPMMGMSTVRQMDDYFKTVALAVAEYRGTSSAHSSGIPCGVLPPMTHPPCPSTGTPPDGCLAVP